MTKEIIQLCGTLITLYHIGDSDANKVHLIFGHGWGQTSGELRPLAECFMGYASCTLIDFPGFGESPAPPGAWNTTEYADALAEWVKSIHCERRVWIGHSFGCRIGMQMAARHPDLLSALILVAAPGLPSKSYLRRFRVWLAIRTFKILKTMIPDGPHRENLRQWLGSADYKVAGEMRSILAKIIPENLANVAGLVKCPTLFIYGYDDVDTPPNIGERYKKMISDSRLVVLKGFDHHSILRAGRHQVAFHVQRFLNALD